MMTEMTNRERLVAVAYSAIIDAHSKTMPGLKNFDSNNEEDRIDARDLAERVVTELEDAGWLW